MLILYNTMFLDLDIATRRVQNHNNMIDVLDVVTIT